MGAARVPPVGPKTHKGRKGQAANLSKVQIRMVGRGQGEAVNKARGSKAGMASLDAPRNKFCKASDLLRDKRVDLQDLFTIRWTLR